MFSQTPNYDYFDDYDLTALLLKRTVNKAKWATFLLLYSTFSNSQKLKGKDLRQ